MKLSLWTGSARGELGLDFGWYRRNVSVGLAFLVVFIARVSLFLSELTVSTQS